MTIALDVQLRNAIESSINTAKAALQFVDGEAAFNQFSVEATYMPYQALTDFPEFGKLWLMNLAGDDRTNPARSSSITIRTIPIQVALHWKFDPTDTATGDKLVLLAEQLRNLLRKLDPNTWQWLEAEALKDPNGTVYSYTGLREAGFFETYFTARYLEVVN